MINGIQEFLERNGALSERHTGRSLHDHLRGTETLLRNWNCSEEVCLAGLFHSIYGTNAFQNACLNIAYREVLAELIGKRAEYLVYVFHICNRPGAFIQALHTGGVVSRLDGQYFAITDEDLAALIEIECANLLEQGGSTRFFSFLIDALETSSVVLVKAVTDLLVRKNVS